MKKLYQNFIYSFMIFIFCAVVNATPSYAAENPVSLLNSIADNLIAQLKANKASLKSDPSLVYSLAQNIIVPHADRDEMSRRVIPPSVWNKASSSQRSEFESEFMTMLVHTYASALADYNDQTVKFFPVRGGYEGKNAVQVHSEIERADGSPISVNYRLVLRGSEWRIFDMSVEGVSMLESFRSQFADQLSKGDMDTLIKHLRSHNAGNGENS